MDDKIRNRPPNAPGKYYVIQDWCAAHQLCTDLAPRNFAMADTEAYVCKQPETAEEEAQCREALECCPMAAIRDDGEIATSGSKGDV